MARRVAAEARETLAAVARRRQKFDDMGEEAQRVEAMATMLRVGCIAQALASGRRRKAKTKAKSCDGDWGDRAA